MKFAFYTNSISPHQLPLAYEMVKVLGDDGYRYVYAGELSLERRTLGWRECENVKWCKQGANNSEELRNAEVLMSGLRAITLFEQRAKKGISTIYCSERWFKPVLGIWRLFVPSYFRMALRFVHLLSSVSKFYYYPMGIHAARDMARLCGLVHGDLRCFFRGPRLEFERMPGGRIWVSGEPENTRKYCLDKMRMWGYFVEEGLGDRSLELEVKECGSEVLKVLWVGRLLKWKRVDTIIRAVGECAKSKKITLDIYGTGPESKRLKKFAAKYGAVIKFYPPVPINDVRKLMREYDVYVLSSNGYEGWGAVVSEALEEGMKVVGTYEAGASATILPASNLFHAGDWMKLVDILSSNIEKTVIGDWTAESAAKVLFSLCGNGHTDDMQ